jgi:hypothetical protein
MIPERRRVLQVRISVSHSLPREKRRFGVAITFRRYVTAVEVHYSARPRMALLVIVVMRPVQAGVDFEAMAQRQTVDPTDGDRLVSSRVDGRTGKSAVVSPNNGGLEIAMELLPKLRHDDLN